MEAFFKYNFASYSLRIYSLISINFIFSEQSTNPFILDEVTWYKEKFGSDVVPPARTQHIAISTPKHDKIFIFGGHSTPQVRLNDTWFLLVQNLNWKRAEGEEPATPRN